MSREVARCTDWRLRMLKYALGCSAWKSLAPRTRVRIIARTESCSSAAALAATKWLIGWARISAPSSAGCTVSRVGTSPGCGKESGRVGPANSPRPNGRRWDVTCGALPATGVIAKTSGTGSSCPPLGKGLRRGVGASSMTAVVASLALPQTPFAYRSRGSGGASTI
jgi:hypothetical protein